MEGRGQETRYARAIVYCIVPRELVRLHELLWRHFADDASVEVIVEQRSRDRRGLAERRAAPLAVDADQRAVRNVGGRRVADRRAPALGVDALSLPRRARAYADRLLFIERIEPSDLRSEDVDTARLVIRIQAGDDGRFGELYERYFDRVYSYLRIVLGNAHAAEDATQQVFLRVLTGLPAYERREQPFRAWLFTIVRNHALTELAKQRRVGPVDPHELERARDRSAPIEDASALDWLTDRELVLFVERLPLAQRQVLMLRFLAGLSNDEIAAILERSSADVRMLQSRALRFLRERLSALGRDARPSPRARMTWAPRHATVVRARRWALRV